MKSIKAVGIILSLFVVGCSSAPKINGQEFQKDQVLSTAGDRSMPDWASEGEVKPYIVKDGKVYSVGITTGRGSDRVEAIQRVSDNEARANIAKTIANNMEFIFQNAEENAGMDSTQVHWVGSEVSKLSSSAITIEGRWYKRYAQTDDDGSRHIYYKTYSLVVMPEAELKQAIYRALNKGVDQHKLSETFQKQVEKHFDKLIDNPDKSVPTASNEKKDNE